jgi:glutamine amidotransferase
VNDDGHGFAVIIGDRVMVKRSWDAAALAEQFAAVRARHPEGPAMFHSRYGTHGSRDKGNVHPFMLGGDSRTVIAHNGILPGEVQPGKSDVRSDTRIAAEDFLPRRFGRLHTKRSRAAVGRWMTAANKFVILTVDRKYRDRSYIINEDAGVWDGGIWYSNGGYQRSRWSIASWRDTLLSDDEWLNKYGEYLDAEYSDCPVCHSYVYSGDGGCEECGFCFDCESVVTECQCYGDVPLVLDRKVK